MNMPAVALRGLTILPGMIAHFDISRERSLRAVEEAMEQDQKIYLVTQRNVDSEDPTQEDLYQMGIVADIKQVVRLQNDVVRILVDGISRAALLGFTGNEKYLEAEICYCDSNADSLPEDLREAMLLGVREAFHRYAAVVGKISKELIRQIDQYEDLEKLIDYVTNNLPVSYELKQQVLEAEDINDRYQVIVSLLLSQVEVISIKNELQKKVKVRVDKHQKEYVLREQLGVIREELGENADSEADEYEKKLSELDAPDYVKEKTKKEIKRFRNMSSSSSESTVERGYIETVLELPWNKMSVDNKDLDHAAQVLDDDHYGLKDVKERILEFLAVRNLTSKGESPIICLVGPPGTGKTSIARSIASALEKKYVRISLGGVRDEAEIRGHRKTYIGAMPGRIVNGLRQAGVSNPLMLLDEIDKVSSDYKGDTSAALLEVLDSEQNNEFNDHYMGVPVDVIRNVATSFKAVEHRIEYVDTINGVAYYNDSKGTNPDAAIKGIQAMVSPTYLIGGGYDKGSEYDEWIEAFDGKVKELVLIGQTADKIEECAHRHGFMNTVKKDTFEDAVNYCYEHAVSGDAVLLSPACASWGMFPNYEERGRIFKEIVKEFKE